MSNDLAVALLDALDEEALAALAERLQPHLPGARDKEDLLTPTQAARRLHLHPKTLTRAAAAGRVPGAVRAGRGWRFHPEVLALEPLTATRRPPRPASKSRTNRARAGQRASVRAIRALDDGPRAA